MEAVWAAVAVVVTAAGGLYTTIWHSGAASARLEQQVAAIQLHETATDTHVATHDKQLNDIAVQNGRIEQKLDDVATTVHDMQEHGVKSKR
jgi:hypothetical protein